MKIIKKYLIKRIVVATMALFLLILFILIPTHNDIEIEPKKKKYNNVIYLLDKDNYVSKVLCYFDSNSIKDEIFKKIDLLKKGINNFKPLINSNTKINKLKIDKNNVYIDFSKELLNTNNKNKMIEAIVYSLTEINGIDNIYITVDGKQLEGISNPLNRQNGINIEYDLNSFDYIDKTIILFAKDDYYVPLTKVSNDNSQKIEIIIKELKSSINSMNSLKGYLEDNIKLVSYNIENDKMYLVFNDELFNNANNIEEIKYLISSSIFENYDVNEIIISNEDKSINMTSLKDS